MLLFSLLVVIVINQISHWSKDTAKREYKTSERINFFDITSLFDNVSILEFILSSVNMIIIGQAKGSIVIQ